MRPWISTLDVPLDSPLDVPLDPPRGFPLDPPRPDSEALEALAHPLEVASDGWASVF